MEEIVKVCIHEETAIFETIIYNTFFSVRLVKWEKKILFIISNPILPHGQLENEAVDKQELMLEYHNSVSWKRLAKIKQMHIKSTLNSNTLTCRKLVYLNNADVKCVQN